MPRYPCLCLCSALSCQVSTLRKYPYVCHPTDGDVFDFVVVGGGTAGSSAAAELARAMPEASVLLLDQGRDFSDESIVMDNDQFIDVQESPYCEHHFSTEQALAGAAGISSDRNIYNCVSKILGGASSINYGGWYRAPASDLDEWAQLSGNEMWNYDNLLPYFKRLENVERDAGATPSPDRGYNGIIPVRHHNISILHHYTGMLSAIETYLGVSVGDQDSNRRDQNAIGSLQVSRIENGCWTDDEGDELGCAKNMRNGSSYNAFIRNPKRASELHNLSVMEGAKVVQVKHVTQDNPTGDMVVEYVFKSYRYVVKARHEILLSAGSWANPKIALLSGIGNPSALEKVGIETKISLPGVGKHLMDHGVLWLTAMLNNVQMSNFSTVVQQSDTSCEDTLASSPACKFGGLCDCEDFVNAPESTGCGGLYKSGMGDVDVDSVCAKYCGLCLDNQPQKTSGQANNTSFDATTFSGVDNPLPALMSGFNSINVFFKSNANLDYPDMELLTGTAPAGPNRALLMLRVYQNKGTSGKKGGSLTLRSDDPIEEMDTTRSWYADDDSIEPMLASLKAVIEMVQTGMAQSAPMILEPNAFVVDYNDDEALKRYIRDNVVSEMHLQSSMKMGIPEDDPMTVVDDELRIVGSNGRIRVADTSIFPTEIRGHPMATAMVVGMKAASLIAADYQEAMGGAGAVTGSTITEATTSSAGNALRKCAFAFAVSVTAAVGCAFAASAA